jgi:hypothetical protein
MTMGYAIAGLALSLGVHLLSYTDFELRDATLLFALAFGMFPLWFLVKPPLARDLVPSVTWWARGLDWGELKAILAECPVWMKYMALGFVVYVVPNFLLSTGAFGVPFFFLPIEEFFHAWRGAEPHSQPAVGLNLIYRAVSGHWMAFYSIDLAIVTAAYRRGLY